MGQIETGAILGGVMFASDEVHVDVEEIDRVALVQDGWETMAWERGKERQVSGSWQGRR